MGAERVGPTSHFWGTGESRELVLHLKAPGIWVPQIRAPKTKGGDCSPAPKLLVGRSISLWTHKFSSTHFQIRPVLGSLKGWGLCALNCGRRPSAPRLSAERTQPAAFTPAPGSYYSAEAGGALGTLWGPSALGERLTWPGWRPPATPKLRNWN